MAFYELDYDEGIVLQSTSAQRNGPSEDDFEDEELIELVITNKRIIYVSEVGTSFRNTKTEVTDAPISSIKIINGIPQVKQIKHDMWGKCIQIQFTHGIEYWTLNKREASQWVDEINRLLGVKTSVSEPVVIPKKEEKKSLFGGIANVVSGLDLQSTIENVQSKIADLPQQMADKVQTKIETVTKDETEENVETCTLPVSEQCTDTQKEIKTKFCSNCGTKLEEGAKFCHGCGSSVESAPPTAQTAQTVPPIPTIEQGKQRKQEYVGRILKCSNCGAVITETTVTCPECGIRITGKSALSSVQAFKDQLMAIENTRKNRAFEMLNLSVQPADKQKLSLIRNFPIPNTIDDIQEFMLLAMANIDVQLSKHTMMYKYQSAFALTESPMTISKTISDAWVAKMQQAYQKAELLFASEAIFTSIQKMYFEKLKELKIKVK